METSDDRAYMYLTVEHLNLMKTLIIKGRIVYQLRSKYLYVSTSDLATSILLQVLQLNLSPLRLNSSVLQ